MALQNPIPYGLRDVKITPYTDATATVLAASSIDLPAAQTFNFTESEDFNDLRGDDTIQTSHGSGPGVDWTLEHGIISFAAWGAISGATVGLTGTTPNQIATVRKNISQVRPFFKIEGQAISDSGGDFHGTVWRAKATGDLKADMADGEFLTPSIDGQGYGSLLLSGPATGELYVFTQNETATPIP